MSKQRRTKDQLVVDKCPHTDRPYRSLGMCASCYTVYAQKKTGYNWKEKFPEKNASSHRSYYIAHKAEHAANSRASWLRKTPEERRFKSAKWRYNLSQEQWDKLWENPSCAICGTDQYLVIDHDHLATDSPVRGLLCQMCNKGLGHFKDDPVLLEKARDYIRNNNV